MTKTILLGFLVAIANQGVAAVPNLTCDTLDQSFNDCPGKSELSLSISDDPQSQTAKLVTFKYDIEAKPFCFQGNPVKGALTGQVYFRNSKNKGFVHFSEEEQAKFSDETSGPTGRPTWESKVLTGRDAQQYILVKLLGDNRAEVELRSYYGVTLNETGDLIPREELRLRRVLNCHLDD